MSQTSKTVNLYFSHIPNSRYVFPNGKEAAFAGGKYSTDNEEEIAHLNAEIKAGNQFIYTKEGQEVVSVDQLDPLYELKAQIRAQILAEQAANEAGTKDLGEYVAPELKPQSSLDLSGLDGLNLKIASSVTAK